MSLAARITDMHICPMVNPGGAPHVGGPILPPGAPTVFIEGIPAARMGDMATCSGPPDTIIQGSGTVLIEGMLAARMGDMTSHGGQIVAGCPTVIIGG
ncbi:PAAR domain-containing protein [soil metagenome]